MTRHETGSFRVVDGPALVQNPDHREPWPLLVWKFPEPMLAISSAPLGGGVCRISWILNAGVGSDYTRTDPSVHLEEIAGALGLCGTGVGMLTAASVGRWRWSNSERLAVATTVGVKHPTWAADVDDAVSGFSVGTINVMAVLPVRLSSAALVNAVVTATEAKSQALMERGIPGTGTASDAIVVACPTSGPAEAFGGPRSVWGARLARAVHSTIAQE